MISIRNQPTFLQQRYIYLHIYPTHKMRIVVAVLSLILMSHTTLTKDLTYDDVVEKAARHLSTGEYEEAIAMLDVVDPDVHIDVLGKDQIAEVIFLKGTSYHGLRDVEKALKYYAKALSIKDDLPGAWKNMGLLYKETGRIERSREMYEKALLLQPNDPSTLNCLGSLMNHAKRYAEALPYLENALTHINQVSEEEDPTSLTEDLLFNLGVCTMHLGATGRSQSYYNAVLQINPSHSPAYLNLASIYHKAGNIEFAITNYRNAIETCVTNSKSDSRLREMGYLNLGVALSHNGSSPEAMHAFQMSRLERTQRPSYVPSNSYDETEMTLLAHEVRTVRTVCDWHLDRTHLAKLYHEMRRGFLDGFLPVLLPFDTLILPISPEYQMEVAMAWSAQWNRLAQLPSSSSSSFSSSRVRVGFLSHDYNDHPTAHMIEGIFKDETRGGKGELNKESKTDFVAISYGKNDGSVFRNEIVSACSSSSSSTCSEFRDISQLSFADGAKDIRNADIEILLDLQAHTLGCRTEIAAMRPSPIQVSFLVYPGTMGAKWIDYLIADRFVVPGELARFYTEGIVYDVISLLFYHSIQANTQTHTSTFRYLPDSYQINYYPSRDLPKSSLKSKLNLSDPSPWIDRFRSIPPKLVLDDGSLPRAAHGLPPIDKNDDYVIFCNFNKIQKFDRKTFMLWLSILRRVPKSVMWLLRPSTRHEVDTVRLNLEREAIAFGVSPSRIIWAPRVPKLAHLSRHRHATLFLDTLVYNAHSTASDSLFGGLPVLTCPAQPFAGRVAAALLHAVGLPELITSNLREYEDLAVRLGRSPNLLRSLRKRLLNAKMLPLFNAVQYRKNFERSILVMSDMRRFVSSSSRRKMNLVVAPEHTLVGDGRDY